MINKDSINILSLTLHTVYNMLLIKAVARLILI